MKICLTHLQELWSLLYRWLYQPGGNVSSYPAEIWGLVKDWLYDANNFDIPQPKAKGEHRDKVSVRRRRRAEEKMMMISHMQISTYNLHKMPDVKKVIGQQKAAIDLCAQTGIPIILIESPNCGDRIKEIDSAIKKTRAPVQEVSQPDVDSVLKRARNLGIKEVLIGGTNVSSVAFIAMEAAQHNIEAKHSPAIILKGEKGRGEEILKTFSKKEHYREFFREL